MNIGLDFRRGAASLPGVLEAVVARINTLWNKEHNTNGTHRDVHARTVTADEVITPLVTGTDPAGLSLDAPTTINLQTDGVTRWRVHEDGHFVPAVGDTYDIGGLGGGTLIRGVRDLYFPDQGRVRFGQFGEMVITGNGFAARVGFHAVSRPPFTQGITIQPGDAGTPPRLTLHEEMTAQAATMIRVERNSSTVGCAGVLMLEQRDGTDRFLWVDLNGVLRSHTTSPQIGSGDTAGIPYAQEGTVTPLTSPNIVYTASALDYQKTGSWVFITGFVVFPATADGNQAAINNLPFTCANSTAARGGCVCHFDTSGLGTRGLVLNNSTTLQFFTGAAAAQTNAALTGATLFFDFKYRANA